MDLERAPRALLQSFEACKRVHARAHRPSYLAIELLTAQKRPYLHALFAFTAWSDRLADEGEAAQRPQAIARWRAETMAELRDKRSGHSLRRAFVHTVSTWDLDVRLIDEFLAACEKDSSQPTRFATFAELRGFLRGVSGTVAELTTPLLEPLDAGAAELMSVLGEAFQMADNLSDLAVDLPRGRCYLPRCDLDRFGLTVDDLVGGRSRAHDALIGFEVRRARGLLAEGEDIVAMLHPSSQPFISAMVRGLGLWFDEIARRKSQLFVEQLQVPLPDSLLDVEIPQPRRRRRSGLVDRFRRIPKTAVPRHVAVIMDGNRRWAAARGKSAVDGHAAGEAALDQLLKNAMRYGIQYLTVYAFSTENWSRPRDEVASLFDLLADAVSRLTQRVHKDGVRIRWCGRRDRIPVLLREKIEHAEQLTAANTRLTLTVCLDYGGRDEIVKAAATLAADAVAGRIDPAAVDESGFARYLHAPDLPDVDLLIRTSGEQRTSNFLPWHVAYAEMVFDDVLWPDFDDSHLRRAISTYASRQRRFGGTRKETR
ncbi:polyprenyl diphosphate synthase [Kibdelosporangium aridum]|uniref:polyprenyl diphosphate synthase n=1 Tax=Kibdelosporangium aridum TaxID=2030 RepID=UPI0005269EF6